MVRPRAIQFQQRPLNNHWEFGCFTTKNASHELDVHMIRKGCFNKHVMVAFISEHNIYRPWLLKKPPTSGFQAMEGNTQVIDLGFILMLWMFFPRWLSSIPEPLTMSAWWWHVAWPGRMDTWAYTWAPRETLWMMAFRKGVCCFCYLFVVAGGVCSKLLGCTLLMVRII